ncbi:MAG: T9SS type A sorting domain-containing protein [Flavobacteriales bacterium]|nr:T9SS type A sorting domain-containing protein [Flavobacteriales bacterium]MBK7239543.1 T9SS type A sorting domain-containing protein [Flavobacteriales bacterium]MBK7296091.1 T9SS type A sorting domain-containing protein [Flavobacteriales bacterium]MBK9535250.1 T9SS type A sorting domain-containing protein [Flavobacteriales bacterium]MBP9137775.1 T9SS type A sorting domain-containing protein [Flavobacteriales bacterium]
MKTFNSLTKGLSLLSVALVAGVLSASQVSAQCTTWVNPNATGGWSDFNTAFGGAPADTGAGCPVNEITDFEIYADEAYAMDNMVAGTSYTFSACNGTGGTAFNISYTIITPSGAVDAYGLDASSNCALTFTASESGTYLLVVSEEGACGTSTNAGTANGFPAITCIGGGGIGITELAPSQILSISPNPSNGIFKLSVDSKVQAINVFDMSGSLIEALTINVTNGGTYTLDMSNYANGTYMVRTVGNGNEQAQRISVIR